MATKTAHPSSDVSSNLRVPDPAPGHDGAAAGAPLKVNRVAATGEINFVSSVIAKRVHALKPELTMKGAKRGATDGEEGSAEAGEGAGKRPAKMRLTDSAAGHLNEMANTMLANLTATVATLVKRRGGKTVQPEDVHTACSLYLEPGFAKMLSQHVEEVLSASPLDGSSD